MYDEVYYNGRPAREVIVRTDNETWSFWSPREKEKEEDKRTCFVHYDNEKETVHVIVFRGKQLELEHIFRSPVRITVMY